MDITTSYNIDLLHQLFPSEDGGEQLRAGKIDAKLMQGTAAICLDALKFCVDVFLDKWDVLSSYPVTPGKGKTCRRAEAEKLIHSTKKNQAVYPEFDEKFEGLPSYTRRAIIADALGMVSSYVSNHKNWEELRPDERGAEPVMGLPERYELTFYEQERDLENIQDGIIRLKLYNGRDWGWYTFQIKDRDARFISKLMGTRKILSPVIEKVHGKFRVRFSFKESKTLVPADNPLSYRTLAVDLGINAPASWCVMTSDGTVYAKGVIHLACDEGRLNRLINRKRQYQQAGKKRKYIYRLIRNANKQLSINTALALIEIAILYDVDCIVFEHLDLTGKKHGKYKERLHMWRAKDVQERVELMAHRNCMRISRVCAWGSSRYAFDGSGVVDRHSVYTYRHGERWYNYSLCTFQSGKIYNCDLSAAQNIGARYFLRLYAKEYKAKASRFRRPRGVP